MDLGGAAHVGEAALMQDRHLVGHHVGELDVVGHHDGRVADARLQLGDELGHQSRIGRVEPGRGLVEEDHLRLHGEGPRDAHALAHPARQLGGHEVVGAGQAHEREQPVDAVGDLALVEARVLAQRVRDVLEDGQRVEERGALKDEAGAPPERQHRFLPQAVDPRAEQEDLAGIRPDEAIGDAQEHGLARAAAAHDGERRALRQGHAHTREHLVVLERLPHVPELDDRRHPRPHQNRKRKSFVRKKSETITPIATCTTVAVVDRPSPSVPPSVARPL